MIPNTSRYKRFNATKTIVPIQPQDSTQVVRTLEPLQVTSPTAPYRSFQERRQYLTQLQQSKNAQTFLADYNDPTELNSFVDALINTEAVSKEFGSAWGTISTTSGMVSIAAWTGAILAEIIGAIAAPFTGGSSIAVAQAVAAPLMKVGTVAAIPAIPAATKVLVDKSIKPLLAGKPKEAFLNSLMNIGETADIFANPVKGLVHEGWDGLAKSYGYMSDEGRTNYDYDTGFFLTDMLLETISDPLNWVPWGTSTATKIITKTAGKALANPITKNIVSTVNGTLAKEVGELTVEQGVKIETKFAKVVSNLIQDFAKLDPKAMTKEQLKQVTEHAHTIMRRSLASILQQELPNATPKQIDTILQKATRSAKTGRFEKSIVHSIQDITFDTTSVEVLRGLNNITTTADAAQRFFNKGAMLSSGYGEAMDLIKKRVGKPIADWATNQAIQRLKKPRLYLQNTGINLKQYEKAKNAWINMGEYMSAVVGEKVTMDENSFYRHLTDQFARDQQLIDDICNQYKLKPIEQIAALDAQFKNLYGCDFDEYINLVASINSLEHNSFNAYSNRLVSLAQTLPKQSLAQRAGAKLKTGAQLLGAKDVVDYTKQTIKNLEAFTRVLNTNNTVKFNEAIYGLKLNNARVNQLLLEDPVLSSVFSELSGSTGIGALLDKFLSDSNATNGDIKAKYPLAARRLKDAALTYQNMRRLYNDAAALVLPELQDVDNDKLREYFIDIIFGTDQETVTELIANFDSSTMPNAMGKLQNMFLYDKTISDIDMGTIQVQFSQLFKSYLEAQQAVGAERINAAIVSGFTTAARDFVEGLPGLADELADLRLAISTVETRLSQVQMVNADSITQFIGNKSTIFEKAGIRELADMGLAIRAIDLNTIKAVFDVADKEASAPLTLRMERLGKAIVSLRKSFMQYDVYFDDNKSSLINDVYTKFRRQFIDNAEGLVPEEAFRYLKNTTDAVEQFTQLVEFGKAIGDDKQLATLFKGAFPLNTAQGSELYRNIHNPQALLKTDFAFDAMAQATWIAEAQLNETLLNGVNTYHNLGLASIKICNDFKKACEVLTANAADRAQYAWQERYIRAVDKVNNTLTFLKDYYEKCFDRELADKQIQKLYNTLLRHPRFEEYRVLIQEIEDYWAGTKSFRQDAKRYIKAGVLPDGTKAVDEFTPWWNKIKQMNKTYVEIQRSEAAPETIQKYFSDQDLYHEYFKTNPEQGEALLDILNNSSRQLTDEDILIYGQFIAQLNREQLFGKAHTSSTFNNISYEHVPWEFIPASIKELDFKYYYEVLGIDDPRLVYNFLETDGVRGWHDFKTNNIVGVLTNTEDFNRLRQTYLHESGHNILERVFGAGTPERFEYLNAFKQKFISKFGEDTFNKIYAAMTLRYSRQYGMSSQTWRLPQLMTPAQQSDVLEEMFTFSLAGRLDDLNFEIEYTTGAPLADDLLQLNKEFSQDLTQELTTLAQQKGLQREAYNQFYKQQQTFTFNNNYNIVTPWDPVKKQQQLNRLIKQATDANARGALSRFLKLTPDEITEELAFRKRFVTFNYDDLNDPALAKSFKELKQKATRINDTHYIYKDKFHIIYDTERRRHWLVLDAKQEVQVDGRTVTLNGNKLVRKSNPKRFEEFRIVDSAITDTTNPGITKTLNDLDDTLYELTGTHLGDSQGENFTKNTYDKIFKLNETGTPANVPQEVWELLPKDKDGNLLYDSFAGKDVYHFNESVLGTAASKAQLGMYGNNAIRNMSNAITQAQAYLKPKAEYINMVFDSSLSINSPNSIWKEFSDEDILEALQQTPDYHLVALVYDKKYGLKTRDIPPISVDAIKKARELGAVIIPTQVYKDLYNKVNHRLGSTWFAKLWSRIIYAYKAGYLLRPGAWIRNFIDTNIKSKLVMGDEYSTYKNLAHKMLDDAHAIKDYIQARSKDGILTKEAIEEFFGRVEGHNNLSKFLTYEQFMELDRDFFSQKISGNIMSDLFTPEGSDLWNSFTHMTGKVVDMFNSTEEYNRLALYLYNLDKGLDYTSALSSLAKTHFDYGFKTKAEQLLDMVFPFATFSMRNYSFWVEMLDKHPWLLRNYVHLMKPHWDFKDYTPEELARDRRVQSQIIYGQLKLGEFNNKVITFKANPSIQDAIQMFSDPINNVYDKLAAPIAEPMKLLKGEEPNINNLIPIAGQVIQSAQTMAKTGTPLPSAIGVQPVPRRKGQAKANGKWSNPNLSGTDKYTDNTYRTPKYRKNIVYDSYAVKGVKRYRLNLYPIVDIAHDIKMRYSTNVYNRIKNRVQQDVYKGIRYRIRLDVNRFR